MPRFLPAILALFLTGAALPALAEGAQINFGAPRQDPNQPVEVSADELRVNQSDGTAVFSGNVIVSQGTMRLTAGSVRVEYATDASAPNRIEKLIASGGVTLADGGEAAEANEAVYSVDSGEMVLSGNVTVTQGQSTLSGQTLVIDINSGNGSLQGRVQTVFRPAEKKP